MHGSDETNTVLFTLDRALYSLNSLRDELEKCWVKFHIIPEMTSHRLPVVKFEIKICRYF